MDFGAAQSAESAKNRSAQNQQGQNQAGQNQAGQNQAGQNQAGQNQGGRYQPEENPGGRYRSESNPGDPYQSGSSYPGQYEPSPYSDQYESAPGRPDRIRGWRSQLGLLVTLIVVGVVLAFVWRWLTPHTAELGDEQEASAAVDGTLALLGLLVGIPAAAFVLLRPGAYPVQRAVAVVVGSLLGAALSWVLGDQLGTPALRATGAAFAWPVMTSVVLFLGALFPWSSTRLNPYP
jgi:hypothetical protein